MRALYKDETVDHHGVLQEFEALRALKRRVPRVVERVGRQAWGACVNAPAAHSGGPPHACGVVISRAFFKMREIFLSCAIPFPSSSLHLCEAPGGFVQWMGKNHPSPSEWSWRAVSLKGGPEFRTDLLPMHRGGVVEGDVLATNECMKNIDPGAWDLVTADGAVQMDHDCLDEEHLELLWSQATVACHALRVGGTFVVKFFEGELRATHLFIAHMTMAFRQVSIIKPFTSRPTNSERYLVCRHFESPVSRDDDGVVPNQWYDDLLLVLGRLASDQTRQLSRILSLLDNSPPDLTCSSSPPPRPSPPRSPPRSPPSPSCSP